MAETKKSNDTIIDVVAPDAAKAVAITKIIQQVYETFLKDGLHQILKDPKIKDDPSYSFVEYALGIIESLLGVKN